jgi:hypothetical protein
MMSSTDSVKKTSRVLVFANLKDNLPTSSISADPKDIDLGRKGAPVNVLYEAHRLLLVPFG